MKHILETCHQTFSGEKHACELAVMSLDIMATSVTFQVPQRPNTRAQMRMGIHSGPAVGLVAGSKLPMYW